MTKRVIQLLRVSTAAQAGDDRASLPSQREVNERTARAFGLTIVKTVEMAGVSGTSVLLAPEMQGMIRLMQDPEIHGVVTREFSRLMRPESYADFALLQVFVDTHTLLYTPDGPTDFASADGRLMGTLKFTLGGIERSDMVRRQWNAREVKRARGELGGSRILLPFGVDYQNGKWFYTPESERIREAFRLVLTGETSYFAIGKAVNIEPRSLAYMLRNAIYAGWRVIDKKRDLTTAGKYPTIDGRQGDRRKIKRSPDEIIRVQVIKEPLVSLVDFELVQKILSAKQSFHWRTSPGYVSRYDYNGFLDCVCNSRVYTQTCKRADYYACKNGCGAKHMRRDVLDPQMDRMFAKTLQSVTFLRSLSRGRKHTGNPENLNRQIEILDAKKNRVLETYFDGVIDKAKRDQECAAIERERQVYLDLMSREEPVRHNPNQLALQFKVFRQFDLLTREDKRRILSTITARIVVANYQVEGMSCSLDVIGSGSLADTAYLAPNTFLRFQHRLRAA